MATLREKLDAGFSRVGNILKDLKNQISTNTAAIANKVDVVQLTKAQYDAMATADKNQANKLYVIVG